MSLELPKLLGESEVQPENLRAEASLYLLEEVGARPQRLLDLPVVTNRLGRMDGLEGEIDDVDCI